MEELFTRKQMENAVMLSADLYQRMYNSPETDGGAQEVAGAIIDEACRMEVWLTEKYGEDDDCYLDRLDEYEGDDGGEVWTETARGDRAGGNGFLFH